MQFWKMNGAGNDFVILNNLEEHLPLEQLPQIARTLCERHMSIGADGLMVVDAPSQGGDYRMLFYNSDGSVGEMCGNGARCICRYGYENGLAGETQTVETTAGIVTGRRIDQRLYRIRLNDPTTVRLDSPVEADLVVGVPESGNAAALGYAMESGIPYGTAFVKNSYVGRTFIKPKQSSRESAVRIKLNVLKEAVAGKRVIMIDDSIVRGTTSALIVKMLRDAGAREVHVRISAPPFLHPCYFGTDIPSEDQLIAHGRTVDEVREIIGADTLSFLRQERLSQMASERPVCTACFTGNYPMEPPSQDIRGSYEK